MNGQLRENKPNYQLFIDLLASRQNHKKEVKILLNQIREQIKDFYERWVWGGGLKMKRSEA